MDRERTDFSKDNNRVSSLIILYHEDIIILYSKKQVEDTFRLLRTHTHTHKHTYTHKHTNKNTGKHLRLCTNQMPHIHRHIFISIFSFYDTCRQDRICGCDTCGDDHGFEPGTLEDTPKAEGGDEPHGDGDGAEKGQDRFKIEPNVFFGELE